MNKKSSRKIQSIENAFIILDTLRTHESASLTEIAEEINLTVGTLHTYLTTLVDCGLVMKQENQYRLGPQLLSLGRSMRNNSKLYMSGREHVIELSENTGQAAHLMTEYRGYEVPLFRALGNDATGAELFIKTQEHPKWCLHWSAGGKAILSMLSDKRVESIIDQHGLPKRTENTITCRNKIHEMRERARDRGYTINNQEELTGLRAVGAPITGAGGSVIGAISVSTPKLVDEEWFSCEVPDLVMEAANSIEIKIQASNIE